MNRQAALPRRPLTFGELLDAALQLARGRAGLLLPVAAVLAVAEQAVLYPVRRELGVDMVSGFDGGFGETFGALWLAMAFGFGLEAFIITMIGPWAGRVAAAELIGDPRSARWPSAAQIGGALPVAALAGACAGVCALAGPLWILGYALFGIAGAAIGLERQGPFSAFGRAASIAFRAGMRVTGVRVLGYFAWLLLRLGFMIGMLWLFAYLSVDEVGAFWVLTIGFTVANTVAYAYLASLDAAALAESRFRSEGLDIWLSRAEQHAPLTPETLVTR